MTSTSPCWDSPTAATRQTTSARAQPGGSRTFTTGAARSTRCCGSSNGLPNVDSLAQAPAETPELPESGPHAAEGEQRRRADRRGRSLPRRHAPDGDAFARSQGTAGRHPMQPAHAAAVHKALAVVVGRARDLQMPHDHAWRVDNRPGSPPVDQLSDEQCVGAATTLGKWTEF